MTEDAAALILNFNPEVAEMMKRSGLDKFKSGRSDLASQNRYLLNGGKLNPVSMKMQGFLFSKNWSMRGRIRMLMEPFIPRGGFENESVTQFITRRFGRELLEKAMDPFVSGTLASDPDLASAAATIGRLVALERKFGSLTLGTIIHKISRKKSASVTETFSFEGGMESLVKKLSEQSGVTFKTQHKALAVEPASYSSNSSPLWKVVGKTTGGEIETPIEAYASNIIFSTPAYITANLVAPLSAELDTLLRDIEYAALSVLHTGFDRESISHPLDGTGFLTPKKENTPFNGNIWMSSLFGRRAPDGKTLLTSYLGGARHPEIVEWSDEKVVDRTVASLESILGVTAPPEHISIKRHLKALPLYHGNYAGRLKSINSQLSNRPGLHIAANYMGGVSVRDRILQGQLISNKIVAQERELVSSHWNLPAHSSLLHPA
jgi:oxygen-dependent protoporphyrinogen oxidase